MVRRSEPTWIFSVASGAFLTRESIGQGRLSHDGLAHSFYRACTIEAFSLILTSFITFQFNMLFSAKQFGQRAKLGIQGGNFALWGPGLFCRVKLACQVVVSQSLRNRLSVFILHKHPPDKA